MFKRTDLHESAALAFALVLAVGVLLWQVVPVVVPSWFDETETATSEPSTGDEAQAAKGPRPSGDAPIPQNPELHMGKLPNGLSYYVLPHKKPEKRAYLWLVIKAGSVHEDDDQLGLAHFVEHMAFNGTAKYQKQQIIDYLESIGMRFGPEINAETGFDRTVYKLKVPTDDPAAVAKGLDILHEWASAIAFDPGEVEAERGVVLEEWRARRGAGMRMAEKLLPAFLAGSKYPDRMPIGTPESIKTSSRERLLRFYRDWYRPDLMAVIAVGDFDADSIEQQIEASFSDLQTPPGARERKRAEVPDHKEPRTAVIADDEAETPIALVVDKLPHEPTVTFEDMREGLRSLMALLTLNRRLGELAQAPDAPFTQAAATIDPTQMIEALDMFQSVAVAKNDRVQEATDALLLELERAERHGFTEAEIDQTRKQMQAFVKVAINKYPYDDGEERLSELVDSFMRGSTFIGVNAYREMLAELDDIHATDTTAQFQKEMGKSSRVVTVLGSTKLKLPTQAQLQETIARIAKADIGPWGKSGETKQLMAEEPTPGKIVGETKNDGLGTIEWKLSNGATVVVKPTDFKDDEILVRAAAPGGLSLVADDDLVTARYATAIAQESGLGNLDVIELRDALAGTIASVTPILDRSAAYIDASARPDDLTTMMQLLHLSMKAPRVDAEAFKRWQTREGEEVANRNALPETRAMQSVLRAYSQDHPRARPVTRKQVEAVSHENALQLYTTFFSDAGDFTFVFVGDVDPEALRPLVATYLASLPSTPTREKPVDTGERPVAGTKLMKEAAGQEPRTTAVAIFHDRAPWSFADQTDQSLVVEVVKLRLREVLREDEGGTYGAGVQGDWTDDTTEVHDIKISFVADPDRVPRLHKLMHEELERIRENGASEEDLAKIRETWKREHEESVKSNEFWRTILSRSHRRGTDPKEWLDLSARLGRVSVDNVKKVAAKFLPVKSHFDFFIEPDPRALKKALAEKAAKDKAEKAAKEAEARAAEKAAKEAERKAKDDAKKAEREARRAAEAKAKEDARKPPESKDEVKAPVAVPPTPEESRPTGGYLRP